MLQIIRTELWKAFHNKAARVAFLIGFTLALLDLIQNTILDRAVWSLSYERSPGGYDGINLFVTWIGINGGLSLGSLLFYIIWPFLAAMPYGWSLYEDRRSHITNNLLTRVSYAQYLASRMIAIFVSGGTAIALPITVNLFASAMICPACIPQVTLPMAGIYSGTGFMAGLFYTHPWIHALLWCGVDFLWGGIAACLCVAVGDHVKHRFFVTVRPFLIFMLLHFTTPLLANEMSWRIELSPLALANLATSDPSPTWIVLAELAFWAAAAGLAAMYRYKKHEIL